MVTHVSVQIASTTYRDNIMDVNIKRRIGDTNSSSTFSILMNNRDGVFATTFDVGQTVTIRADVDVNPPTTVILVGRISDISFDSKDNHDVITITGKDQTSLLQNFTVEPEVYNNTEVSVIVEDIIDKYAPGITTTNVQVTSKTMTRIVFLQKNVYDAIKELAEFAGYYFFVDTNSDLNFAPAAAVDSGLTFNNTNVTEADFEESDDELWNRIYVYGDRILTGHQDILTGDGGSVFTLTYRPHNTTVTISGNRRLSGGIFEMADPVSNIWQYLVNFDSRQLIFTSGTRAGNNLIGSGGSFIVDYFRDVPIVKVAQDTSSQELYGIRTKLVINKEIKDPRQAVDVAQNQLEQFSEPVFEGRLKLFDVFSVTPGQLATINLPNEGITSTRYTIIEADYDFNPINNQIDDVLKVKVSNKRRDILDTLKQIILDIRRLQAGDIDTDDVITRIQLGPGSYGVRVSGWSVRTRTIGQSFILGHPINGRLGSPILAVNGSQVTLGDFRSAFTVQVSGTDI